eukprot:c48759_g1_i1 orf=171-434(+)
MSSVLSRSSTRSFRNATISSPPVAKNLSPASSYARRSASGRYASISREDFDMSGDLSSANGNYMVHLPPTPDNQPMIGMDPNIVVKA